MTNKRLFLDTSYVLALFNTRDQWHETAKKWQEKTAAGKTPLITTEFVLIELGDGLSSRNLRQNAGKVIRTLYESALVQIVPAEPELFQRGLSLFEDRKDKDWGLTDCTSFVVMKEHNISEALTTDEHFRQAGFTALLLD